MSRRAGQGRGHKTARLKRAVKVAGESQRGTSVPGLVRFLNAPDAPFT